MNLTLYILDTDSVTFQQAGRETILRHLETVPAEVVHTTVINSVGTDARPAGTSESGAGRTGVGARL